jgi:hypothetical protein
MAAAAVRESAFAFRIPCWDSALLCAELGRSRQPPWGSLFPAVLAVTNEPAKNDNPDQDDDERIKLAISSIDFDFK